MILRAENLGKRYNHEWIFRNLNHTFQPGIYTIVGPNGSGKSTLLQVLWGQLPASAGNLTYTSGERTISIEDVQQHLMIATPYMELIEEFTLTELLKFHFSFKKIRGSHSLENLMDLMELSHARHKQIAVFSSGMKQRLKLALAFFSDVEMVFLDEPTSNLDKKAIDWYWHHFNQLPPQTLIFIGSNLENECPVNATPIQLMEYKRVTSR
ncbi:MAG TPA: ATP-binding cassette domain-containing protein [Cyclobacteriaceae bacterium]|nr:ATP-binding cassette domain-containing protein [Cyclobacteriaceae bacterium]